MTVPSDASRRDVLKVVGAGVAAVAVVTGARGAAPRAQHEAAGVEGPLAELAGRQLGPYRVESVGALDRGGIPVVMSAASGTTFRVDVLRVDPTDGPAGIGAVSAVSVYLRNGGNGNTATNEEQGLGAMALAEALAGWSPPSALLTRGEREALDATRIA